MKGWPPVAGPTFAVDGCAPAARLGTAQRDADNELRSTVDQVNALARQLADINIGIANVGTNNAADESDRRGHNICGRFP